MNLPSRFLAKVLFGAKGCWVWQGTRTSGGYGLFKLSRKKAPANRRTRCAHRVAYEALVGPIPAGFQLDHLCRNRACVNPMHLEPVTPKENTRRSEAGKNNREKTACPRGHAYTEENTRRNRGRRYCRKCEQLR